MGPTIILSEDMKTTLFRAGQVAIWSCAGVVLQAAAGDHRFEERGRSDYDIHRLWYRTAHSGQGIYELLR
jgi:hypothetical protein